jgi:hypothetical protein
MEEFIINAPINLIPYDPLNINEGTYGIIDTTDSYVIVTTTHLDHLTHDWVCEDVSGNNYIENLLYYLVIDLGQSAYIKIKEKDWEYILQEYMHDDGAYYMFNVKPKKFKNGPFNKECNRCHAHYEGAKNQRICQTCCIDLSEASLLKTSEDRKGRYKGQKYTHIQMREIASWAFELGSAYPETSLKRLNKLITNYLNIDYGNNSN